MKHFYYAISLSLLLLFFPACRNQNSETTVTKKVIAEKENKSTTNSEGNSSLNQQYPEEEKTSPRINIDNQSLIEYIQNVNLDFDTEEEQVIVQKDRETKNKIKIIVVDFDNVRNKYITTWETVLENINPRTFIISYIDIVGDHNLEIIFRGTGSNNEQILDIYRKTHSPAGIRLYYENIADIKIDGQIDIMEKERSAAYLQGQKNGISFPVVTYERDEESENILDMVKKTFIWNYQSSRFIKSLEEKIPGEKIEEEKLRELFNEDIDAYQDFLQGQWINSESSDSVISFDKNNKEIALYSKDILEIYKWTDFIRSKFPQLVYISARNDLIHFIRKNIRIDIKNLNKINITVTDRKISDESNPWNGNYEKVEGMGIKYKNQENNTDIFIPEGIYKGINNTIDFEGSDFIFESEGEIKKGFFSVYEYNGVNIIELRYLNSNRLVGERKSYSIEHSTFDTEDKIINEIRLQDGELKSGYFDASGEDLIIYKQTIEKE